MYKFFTILFLLIIFASVANAATGTINSSFHTAQVCQNIGCTVTATSPVNFGYFTSAPSANITISDNELTGYMWGQAFGYAVLNCSQTTSGCSGTNGNFKVTNNSGTLSGYAWGDTSGWINFGPFSNATAQVTINSSGEFNGYAWAQNYGWIKFDCSDSNYCVKTSWALPSSGSSGSSGGYIPPTPIPPTPSPIAPTPILSPTPPVEAITPPETTPQPTTPPTNVSVDGPSTPPATVNNSNGFLLENGTNTTSSSPNPIQTEVDIAKAESSKNSSNIGVYVGRVKGAVTEAVTVAADTFWYIVKSSFENFTYNFSLLPDESSIEQEIKINSVLSWVFLIAWLLFLFVLLLLWINRPYGLVLYKENDKEVSDALVTIISMKRGEVKFKKAVDSHGRYYSLLRKGIYMIQVAQKDQFGAWHVVYTSDPIKLSFGFIKQVVKI